ncbi:MAG: CNNM domain-containing protein, partial [Flavobacteriales bacterium]
MDAEPPSILLSVLTTNLLFSILSFVILFFLLIGSALVSGAEVAFCSLTKKQLQTAKETQVKRIKIIENLLRNPQKLLATILITKNFINVAIVILSVYLYQEFLFPHLTLLDITFSTHFIINIIGITFLILLFGEILPTVYANKKALQFSIHTSKLIFLLQKTCAPLSYLLSNSTNFLELKFNHKKE